MTDLRIRRAGISDARAIAEILIGSWRETYAGIMPVEHLAALDVAERARRWRGLLAEPQQLSTFVVSRGEGPPEGFGACGAPRSQRLAAAGFVSEFHALYLLRSIQRRGAGTALMRHMARRLRAEGATNAGVWVFRDNPGARRFYEALGGEELGLEGVWGPNGIDYPDLAYGWRDLGALAAPE
ncbi:GNAT family N-acetyltransferase [Methylocystis sp. 9N]|uniref:GNAT family N-acetyltransferase n=1 Tax=Methylocystis borbori TaxID=3118750 RepID=A0ABU7XCG4_9HYPH